MERLGNDDAPQGQHGHISRTAADVDDHVADRIIDGQVDAEAAAAAVSIKKASFAPAW